MELSKNYFKQLGHIESKKKESKKATDKTLREVHQCSSCFTVYDEVYGDAKALIAAGTLFSEIPDNYTCPVCDASKANFEKKEIQMT